MSGAVHNTQGRVSLVSRWRRPMLGTLLRSNRFFQIGAALAVAAVAGWGIFAFSALSCSEQIAALTADRDSAVASYQQLQGAVGNLKEVEAKLGAGRQELAALTEQLEETGDRGSQAGSFRTEPSNPPTGRARKP